MARDPEVMLTTGPIDSLTRWRRFTLRAVQSGQLHALDGDLITRPSLRLLDGARDVCARLAQARSAPAMR